MWAGGCETRAAKRKMWRRLVLVVVLALALRDPTMCVAVSSNGIERGRSQGVASDGGGGSEHDNYSTGGGSGRVDGGGVGGDDMIGGGCGSCRKRQEIRTRSLETIKEEVLKKLGFANAPNMTGHTLPKVPPHVFDMLQEQNERGLMQGDEPRFKTGPTYTEEDDNYHVKTEKVITFAQPYPRLRHSWRGHDILHFSFTESITKYLVSNATLFVYVEGAERRPQATFIIEILQVYRDIGRPDVPGTRKVAVRRITQPLGRGEWIRIDITSMVSEWFKNSRDNLGFIVNGTVNGRRVVIADALQQLENGNKAPFVEILTMEGKKRTRRNSGFNCDDKSNESVCCRYPLTVDFEEFGWDFIIAPKRYEAHYCAGDCPYVTLQKHPHTHLLRMASPDSAGPCCTPRKMSAISMLYFDQQFNVIYGSLPGMVVDRCGCL